MVSHDISVIDSVCKEIWVSEQGTVKMFRRYNLQTIEITSLQSAMCRCVKKACYLGSTSDIFSIEA